jgi:hypothetical protein
LQFAQQVQGISGGDITFDTIPIVNISYWTPGDGDAVEVDPSQVKEFVAARFSDASNTPATSTTTTPPTSPTGKAAGAITGRSPIVPDTSTTTGGQPITADGVTCVN